MQQFTEVIGNDPEQPARQGRLLNMHISNNGLFLENLNPQQQSFIDFVNVLAYPVLRQEEQLIFGPLQRDLYNPREQYLARGAEGTMLKLLLEHYTDVEFTLQIATELAELATQHGFSSQVAAKYLLYIFCPLLNYFGLTTSYTRFKNIGFRVLAPEQYASIDIAYRSLYGPRLEDAQIEAMRQKVKQDAYESVHAQICKCDNPNGPSCLVSYQAVEVRAREKDLMSYYLKLLDGRDPGKDVLAFFVSIDDQVLVNWASSESVSNIPPALLAARQIPKLAKALFSQICPGHQGHIDDRINHSGNEDYRVVKTHFPNFPVAGGRETEMVLATKSDEEQWRTTHAVYKARHLGARAIAKPQNGRTDLEQMSSVYVFTEKGTHVIELGKDMSLQQQLGHFSKLINPFYSEVSLYRISNNERSFVIQIMDKESGAYCPTNVFPKDFKGPFKLKTGDTIVALEGEPAYKPVARALQTRHIRVRLPLGATDKSRFLTTTFVMDNLYNWELPLDNLATRLLENFPLIKEYLLAKYWPTARVEEVDMLEFHNKWLVELGMWRQELMAMNFYLASADKVELQTGRDVLYKGIFAEVSKLLFRSDDLDSLMELNKANLVGMKPDQRVEFILSKVKPVRRKLLAWLGSAYKPLVVRQFWQMVASDEVLMDVLLAPRRNREVENKELIASSLLSAGSTYSTSDLQLRSRLLDWYSQKLLAEVVDLGTFLDLYQQLRVNWTMSDVASVISKFEEQFLCSVTQQLQKGGLRNLRQIFGQLVDRMHNNPEVFLGLYVRLYARCFSDDEQQDLEKFFREQFIGWVKSEVSINWELELQKFPLSAARQYLLFLTDTHIRSQEV